jgi:poly(ribitol-phosphate) beta-N-acetylglucosaminyltransferase
MKHVAVITPIFNTQDYLHRCIRSVLEQDGVEIELILIDDGSTDNSAAIAQHYQQRDSRVVFVRQSNAGQGPARNRGLALARAEYVYFVDSDDHLGPGALATLYRTAREHSLDICSPGVPAHYFDKPLEWVACLPCKSQFMRRDLLERHAVRQPDARSGQDGVFSHLALTHCARIGMTTDAVFHYTHARDGSTFAHHLKRHDLVPDIVGRHFAALRAHYDAHGLWASQCRRLLAFVGEETLRNRIRPHLDRLDPSQRLEALAPVQAAARQAWARLPDAEHALVAPAVRALVERDLSTLCDGSAEALRNERAGERASGSRNLRRGPVLICKLADEANAPKASTGSPAGASAHAPAAAGAPTVAVAAAPLAIAADPAAAQALLQLSGKVDLLLNTLNNATAQLSSAIRLGPRGLEGGQAGLVVSLTTLAHRLPTVHLAIESILSQSLRPERIVLWVSPELHPQALAQPALQAQGQRGLDIRAAVDVGPHTKLIHALAAFPQASIVTVDDDIIYPLNALQALWDMHRRHPEAIVANWARRLAFDDQGRVRGVRAGPLLTPPTLESEIESPHRHDPTPDLLAFPYGTGGVLYPPHSLHPMVADVATFRRLCPKEDDIWFKAMAMLQGTPVVTTALGTNPKHHCLTGTQQEALRHENHGHGANERQMRAVFEALGLDAFSGPPISARKPATLSA